MNRRLVLATSLVAFASGCGEATPDVAPAEDAPPQGVFGTTPTAVGGVPSVVTLTTPAPVDTPAPVANPVLDQLGLVFSPTRLLLRAGQPFVATNSESIGHNIHIRDADTDTTVINRDTDPSQELDLAIDSEGAYIVGCDVHPGMRAVIYVTDAPYAAFADDDGSFLVPGVPPGTYTLHVWSADPELRSERTVEVSGASTEVSFAP